MKKSSMQEMAVLCTQVMTRCDCEGCNRYATWRWAGLFVCDTCKSTQITEEQIAAAQIEPEEFENASAVRRLALMLKEVRNANSFCSPNRSGSSDINVEVIHRKIVSQL